MINSKYDPETEIVYDDHYASDTNEYNSTSQELLNTIDSEQYSRIESHESQEDEHYEIAQVVSPPEMKLNSFKTFKRKRLQEKSPSHSPSPPKTVAVNKEDEFDIFGRSIAIQMKTLPSKYAFELQSKIQELVSATKIRALSAEINKSS